MENIFMKKKEHATFDWGNLGNIKEGRGDIGEEMPVVVYRLMQYTMLDVLSKEFGKVKANALYKGGGTSCRYGVCEKHARP